MYAKFKIKITLFFVVIYGVLLYVCVVWLSFSIIYTPVFWIFFYMLFANDFLFLLPELHWVFSIIGLLLFSTTLTTKTNLVLVTRLGYVFLFFILCFIFLLSQSPVSEYALFNYHYISDPLIFSFKLAFLFFLLICVYISLSYFFFERVFFTEYYFLIGFFCISAFLLASANDLIVFYLAIELQSLILYTLAAIKRFNVFSTESGLKYFVLGAFSSGLLLFGISLFYGFCGTLNFFDIKFLLFGWSSANTYFAVTVALVFFISAILFKLAAAPFHIWTPDVYDGAPSPIVLLFATLPKVTLFIFIVRFFFFFVYDYINAWYFILFFSGLLSVLIGTVAALNQLNIKRLYAYSAIVNVGYLVTMLSYGTLSGFIALFNYLIVYVLSTLSVFAVLLMFRTVFGLRKIKYLVDYRLFLTHSSVFSVFFALVFFSLAGVPPLAGFFIKFFLFKTIFMSEFMLNPAVFIILVVSVVSAFYYIRVVRFIFFDMKRMPALFIRLDRSHVFLFVSLTAFITLFALFQQFFIVGISFLLNFLVF